MSRLARYYMALFYVLACLVILVAVTHYLFPPEIALFPTFVGSLVLGWKGMDWFGPKRER